ncbi:MAG TPA: DUF5818 domain-containing protein [Terriglobales bacterium]|nr:DUF5818 domain-containing protein [Terriglobales bacterium]
MKKYLIRGSVLALVLGVASMGSMYAQNATPQNDQQMRSNSSQDGDRQPEAKSFTGTIVKQGNKLMLRDPSSNVSYKVDDESKVKDYVGKQVKIVGTLDASTNVILVESIEIVS